MAIEPYTKTILISLVVVILLFPASSGAQSSLALQEKCLETGKKFFLERIESYGGRWGSFSDQKGHGYNDFSTHYNEQLEKCFIRIEYSYFPKDRERKSTKVIEIFDVFGGIRFANISLRILSPPDCKVENNPCNSLSEFETLIEPYMQSKGEVSGGDWEYFASGEGGIFCWYDSQSMTIEPNRTIRLWTKIVEAKEIVEATESGTKIDRSQLEKMTSGKDYKLYLMELDCTGKTVHILRKYNYNSKGVLKAGESQHGGKRGIPADSVAEKLYKDLCK